MPAYWVARSRISDPVEYKKYTDRVPAIIAKYGGKVLARGGRYQIMEGPDKFHRFVVIEFPSFEQGVACFQSDEYNKAAAFRRGENILDPIVRDGVGDVRGKKLLHLQCHFGLDTLSLARMGAEVTGLDFSGEAVATARAISAADNSSRSTVMAISGCKDTGRLGFVWQRELIDQPRQS